MMGLKHTEDGREHEMRSDAESAKGDRSRNDSSSNAIVIIIVMMVSSIVISGTGQQEKRVGGIA